MNPELIQVPTLLLDPQRCRQNIYTMAEKARSQNVLLRPHFKTHQSHHIGRWFRDEGINRITVSSVGMARYFADDGWDDITIAFPVNVREINEIKTLAAKVRLSLLVVDAPAIEELGRRLTEDIQIWIKVDVGTHRTGLNPDHTDQLDVILERLQHYPQLHFAGFLAHAGHTYQSRTVQDVQDIYNQSLKELIKLKQKYQPEFPGIQISLGDTPGASMADQYGEVDELRPGNFVFYDLMQEQIGACDADAIAVAMACPVVAIHPERWQWVIYGGAVHFSKDAIVLADGQKCYGRMVTWQEQSWHTGLGNAAPFLISLSQEHGIVQCTSETFSLHQPGDLSYWLPVHSCLTADAMGAYHSLDGPHPDHYRRHALNQVVNV